jgi:hypothetical protein
MGQFLRDRWLRCGRPHRIAVRCGNADCAEAGPERGRGRCHICDPTIVHFCTTLSLSALLRVPWRSIIPAAAISGLVGCARVAYAVRVARRMRTQVVYRPEFRRLVGSRSVAAGGIRDARRCGVRGSLPYATGPVCGWRCGVGAALRRHSQRLG